VPWPDLLALLAPLGVVVFHLRDVLFAGRIFYGRDIQFVYYPHVSAFVRALAAGSWPVWNPHAAFGQPLWAFPSVQAAYPVAWLSLFLHPATYYATSVAAHLCFSALGMYCLARRFDVSRAGASLAAAAWIACGPVVSMISMVTLLSATSWLPWTLLLCDLAVRAPRLRNAFLWGAAMAAPVLAGAETSLLAAVLVVPHALGAADWRRPRGARTRAVLRACVLAFLFAVGLSAAQWLPTLELASRSARGALAAEIRTFWSLHPAGLLQVVLPVFFRDVMFRDAASKVLRELEGPYLSSLHLGVPLVILAGAGLGSWRRRPVPLLALVSAFALLLALGRHSFFYDAAVTVLPPLRLFRFPVKAFILVAFCACLLAGFGLDAWRRAAGRRERVWLRLVPAATLVLLAAATAALAARADDWGPRWILRPDERTYAQLLEPTALGVALSAALAAVFVALALAGRPRGRAVAAGAAAVLAVTALLAAHATENPTAPRELYAYRPPLVEAMAPGSRIHFRERRAEGEGWASSRFESRVQPVGIPVSLAVAIAVREYLFPAVASLWGMSYGFEPDIEGIQTREQAQITALLRGMEGTPLRTRLLQLGSIDYVVALDAGGLDGLTHVSTTRSVFQDPIHLYAVPGTRPKVYAVGSSRAAEGDDALAVLVAPDFDPAREVVLSGPGAAPRAAPAFRATVRTVARAPDRVEVEADLEAPGYVVFVQTHDPNWKATLDGAPAPLLRANLAFVAVPAPAGRHRVVLRYRPWAVGWGLAVTGAALGAGLIGLRSGRRA
jgi:hypothetical protein